MDIGTLLFALLVVAGAGFVLVIARGSPPDDGDSAAVAAALLAPWLESAPGREATVHEDDEPVRWRVELARAHRPAPGATPPGPRSPRRPVARPLGDAAGLGR